MAKVFEENKMVKGVPEAREGFEQRLVVHRKYKAALAKGWVKRSDNQYVDNDFILCERLIAVECAAEEPIEEVLVHVPKELNADKKQ